MAELIPVVTPVGELHYVNISGQGKQNYNEDGYNYVATIYLDEETSESLRDQIDEIIGEIPKNKNLKSKGYRELMEDDEGIYTPTKNTTERDASAKATGIYAFNFSTTTTIRNGKAKKISVYNSANPPSRINLGDRKIANGSKGAISGRIQRYEKGKDIGISLFLNAVQLKDFKEYVEDAGFVAQEGGFIGDGDGFSVNDVEGEVDVKKEAVEKNEQPKKKLKL